MSDASAALLPRAGDLVLGGRYRVERLVGRGGMGVVFAARHELLEQPVALKLLLPEVMNEDTTRRFLHEARACARIKSEHVAKVMDVGTLDTGVPFILMELLDGRDLGRVLRKDGPLPVPLAVDYAIQALEALSAAHALHIVHRDLKPSNLFIAKWPDGSEVLKVLDFGISKSSIDTSPDMAQTSTRALLGSPLYISPEQFRSSRTVDTRADIWAMGVILYELLSGATPFSGETLGELFVAILEQPLMPLRERRPDVPPAIDQIVGRCLARDRDARFQNVAELAYALAPFGTRDVRVELERMSANLGPLVAARTAAAPQPVEPSMPSTPIPQNLSAPPPRPPMTTGMAQSASAQRAWAAPPETGPSRAGIVAILAAAAVVLGVLVVGTLAVIGPRRAASHATTTPTATATATTTTTATATTTATTTATATTTTTTTTTPTPTPTDTATPPATATGSAVAAKDDPPPRTKPTATTRPPVTPPPPGTSILDKRR